jgi:4'-phosphopantetheinyl transferase
MAGLAKLLDVSERTRVAELRDEADRASATTARALLRLMCGTAFVTAPQDVGFARQCAVCDDPHGKPRPITPAGFDDLHVSVSRAGDLVVVAAGHDGPVGVDVEPCSAIEFEGFDDVALTPQEKTAIAELPDAERNGARTTAWVRKEALLKLHGLGLSLDPSTIEVTDDVRSARTKGPHGSRLRRGRRPHRSAVRPESMGDGGSDPHRHVRRGHRRSRLVSRGHRTRRGRAAGRTDTRARLPDHGTGTCPVERAAADPLSPPRVELRSRADALPRAGLRRRPDPASDNSDRPDRARQGNAAPSRARCRDRSATPARSRLR